MARLVERVMDARRVPVATYRLQFGQGFGFRELADLIPYLHDLGVSDVYVSPFLHPTSDDSHGYDIADHGRLNAALGSDADYRALCLALRERGMGQIVDVVPNHMGIAGSRNAWWTDVLENGPASLYSGYFDIEWDPPEPALHQKVLLPILGDQYGNALENQELTLQCQGGGFAIRYFDTALPVAPETYAHVLDFRREEFEASLGQDDPYTLELQSIVTALSHLPGRGEADPERRAVRARERVVIRRRLATLFAEAPAVRAFVDENVARFNGVKGQPASFDRLDALLGAQAYRLAFWQVAADEINYRRFFDINTLAAIRMEDPDVFEAAHRLIFGLVRAGQVTGLRIDHPDGLYAPGEYLRQLQRRCIAEASEGLADPDAGMAEEDRQAWLAAALAEVDRRIDADPAMARTFFIAVEKILMPGELLPDRWPVAGTTGYDFLRAADGVFINRAAERALDETYTRFLGQRSDVREIVYAAKQLVIDATMVSEVSVLGRHLGRLSDRHRASRDFTTRSLITALREIIASFPVYRTYIDAAALSDRDRWYVDLAVARARRRNPAMSASVFDFIGDVLRLRFPGARTAAERAEQLAFVGKFQQLTGPITAKGVEDTAFYRYHRLISLNEVGGAPEHFGVAVDEFHRLNAERLDRWPAALLATSTHDTKRSEDVRARINVLSELPREWRRRVLTWRRLNRRRKELVDGQPVPDANEEYALYQTLLGAWPLGPLSEEDLAAFAQRIQRFMLKAGREAKVHSSWLNPAPERERAVARFVTALLDPRASRAFLSDFLSFQREVARWGMYTSLALTLLKMTAPGVPDFYQGTEVWDFSLVDPDNRRPVDFALRRQRLADLEAEIAGTSDLPAFARRLVEEKEDGRIKLFTIRQGLAARREHAALFGAGAYHPLEVVGPRAEHVCAYARVHSGRTALILVPRMLALGAFPDPPLGTPAWGAESSVLVPADTGRSFRNVLTWESLRAEGGRLDLAAVFASFPGALLIATSERAGGQGARAGVHGGPGG
jgi:(1->4)-alpha-D-glucan 1-alpha-D-glucosylmutase